jgi:hypothetical protein
MADGVRIERHLPLEWTAQDSFDPAEIADWMHGNTRVLQALASLETLAREGEGESRIDPELARLEAKVDLALALVAELVRSSRPFPPTTWVSLGSEGLEWAATGIATGSRGVVSVYLSPRLPWPLRLPVEVTAVHPGRVTARLLHLNEETQHWLDRTVFRHHRRTVQSRPR